MVDDIHATGPLFTWWNGQDHNPTHKKLDRALGNSNQFNHMTNASITVGSRGLSDHAPLILHTGIALPRLRKPFQFFNYMLNLDGFTDLIASTWQNQVSGNPLFILAEKLRHVKKALVTLNINQGNLTPNVQKIRQDLHAIQQAIDSTAASSVDNTSLRAKERLLHHQLWRAITLEENLAQQKSRVQWLEQGDKNTGFFFNKQMEF